MRALLFVMIAVAGCAGPPRPLPVAHGDERAAWRATEEEAGRAEAADIEAALASLSGGATKRVLALSSGGQHGAYGAGVIAGWGESGERPECDLVTGSSTGALIAVFAFLGEDAALRAMYTSHSTGDVYTPYPWVSVLASSAYAASTPLRETIGKYVTDEVVESVGREAGRGRVLLISTTNLDLNRMRVWNMTALAADESRPLEERGKRFRQIVVASLSIPSLVPPVFIDGCMHADGGLIRHIFVSPEGQREAFARALGVSGGPEVWVVINRRVTSPPRLVRNQIIPIAARSIQVMIDAALARDIEELRAWTGSMGGRLEIASLGEDPERRRPEGFLDTEYMKEIYELGVNDGRSGRAWVAGGSGVSGR